jgi:hypothetical protein
MSTAEDNASVGGVLTDATKIYFRTFPRFALVAILSHVPVMLLDAFTALAPPDMATATSGLTQISMFLGTVALAITSAYVVPPVMSELGHRQAPALSQVSSRIGGALVTAWVSNFIVGIGLLCFVIPGIVLSVWYCVAIAASVAEGLGAGAAMERSKVLTEGHRGAAVLLALAYGSLLFGTILATIAPGIFLAIQSEAGAEHVSSALLVISAVLPTAIQALVVAFGAAIYTVFYMRLRELKDGIDASAIADVFS